jgi:hypothetical protein
MFNKTKKVRVATAEELKVQQEKEVADLQDCSQEVGAALQKYGYRLNIQQTIVLEKLQN